MDSYKFLNSSDFEKESIFLVERIYSIVKPQYVMGFIYSFFVDYHKTFGREIKPILVDAKVPYFRNPNLYNLKTKEITLDEAEIEYINKSYFMENLDNSYKVLFGELDNFHRYFKDIVKPNLLIDLYGSILQFLSLEEGAYKFSFFKNHNGLDINRFRDEARNKLYHYTEAIKEKSSLLNINSEIYPALIFTSVEFYNKFKKYQSKFIKDHYNDFSFLFKRMYALKMIHNLPYKTATEWLYKENYINDEMRTKFLIKGSFNTKSSSALRLANFENIFFDD